MIGRIEDQDRRMAFPEMQDFLNNILILFYPLECDVGRQNCRTREVLFLGR